MATKRYNQENFYIELTDGRTLGFYCWTTSTRNGFCHTCWCVYTDQTTKISYSNRTWECYDYQTVLRSAFNKLGSQDKFECMLWEKKHEQQINSECSAWIKSFESAYNSLSPQMKETLAQKDIMISTKEQADAALSFIKVMSAVGA